MGANTKNNETPPPKRGEPNWQDFVIGKLTKNEIQDGNPTAAGLRRVCEIVLGTVIVSAPKVLQYPDKDNNRAVVQYDLSCILHEPISPKHEILQFSAIAESNSGNLTEPYTNHMVATAETRAEGRAFKKLMLLNFSTAEELMGGKTTTESASDIKLRSIRKISSNLALDFPKFLAKYAGLNEDQFGSGRILSKEKADSLLSTLNDFMNDKSKIPGEILV